MNALFSLDDLSVISPVLVADAGHLGCGAWQIDDTDTLVCACGERLFVLEDREAA